MRLQCQTNNSQRSTQLQSLSCEDRHCQLYGQAQLQKLQQCRMRWRCPAAAKTSSKTSRSILQKDKALPKEGPKLGSCEVCNRRLAEDGQKDLRHLQVHREGCVCMRTLHFDGTGATEAGLSLHRLGRLSYCTLELFSCTASLCPELCCTFGYGIATWPRGHLLACCCTVVRNFCH